MIRGVPLTVWALRAAVVLGPAVALWAPAPEGYTPSPFVVSVVLLSALGWAFAPDHLLGTMALVVVLVWWAVVVGAAVPLAAVVAAAGLLLSHSAATVLAYGPARTRVAPRLLATWAIRATAVWVVAPVIWLVADAFTGQPTPASFWLLGLGAALVGAVVAALWAPVRAEATVSRWTPRSTSRRSSRWSSGFRRGG
jgi:hypothetical protein